MSKTISVLSELKMLLATQRHKTNKAVNSPVKLARQVKFQVYALLIVAVASLIRALFLANLGRATPYLTYYPAVMLAAYMGDLYSGLMSVILSSIMCTFWIQGGTLSFVEGLALGVFVFSSLMITTITDALQRARNQAKLAQAQAEASNQAKSIFLANMSHELRTPLNAILGFSNLMQLDPGLSESSQKTLAIINQSGKHLLTLINDILDMAKIESGRIEIEKQDFELLDLVEEVFQMMNVRAKEKSLQLAVETLMPGPIFLHSDGIKIRQVLINLIGNAVKFTSQGTVTVYIELVKTTTPEVEKLIIKVIDTGIGIAPENQEKIFEPFIQLNPNNTNTKGTGLGLPISKKYIKLLGGNIQLSSQPGFGSTFTVELPVEKCKNAPTVKIINRQIQIPHVTPEHVGRKILIIEDQKENWLLLKNLMERSGLQTRVAENGVEGIKLFQEWFPELIWMDIRMAIMDGIQAMREIRQLPGGTEVKIIALSASMFQEERSRILSIGFDGFIHKPYEMNTLYECLASQLNIKYQIHTNETEEASPLRRITPQDFQNLSPEWLGKMNNALVCLDTNLINNLIEELALQYPILAEDLARYADAYNFDMILELLQPSGGKNES